MNDSNFSNLRSSIGIIEKEIEKESLREELSSLKSVLDTRQAEAEACAEGMRLALEKCTNKHILTFQEWLTSYGNSKLERKDAIVAYLDYLENV